MTNEEQQRVERSIVLHLLDRDRWTIADLQAALPHTGGLVVRHALGELEDCGVAVIAGDEARASGSARRLDDLGLVAA